MRLKQFFVMFLFVALTFFAGCAGNNWKIDVSGINTNQKFKAFDEDLFHMSLDSIWQVIPVFEKTYGNFFSVYNTHIIRIGGTNQIDYDEKLSFFLTDPDIKGAFSKSQQIISKQKLFSELEDGFKHYKYYFPDKALPDVYTHISGFNQSIVIDTNYISISLDKYLGSSSKYYQMLRTPMYIRKNMHPAKIPTDVMMAWGETEFIYESETENLLNKMIHYGKLHVYLDAMCPVAADTLKWGFSEKQFNWVKNNERQMWVYLVENKLLFTTAFKDINKYINEGPFTSTFSKESPARTGQWIGYQIVISYLKANSDVSLVDLMNNNDYQDILNRSKYKP